ncbi:MAG TPA: GNAT family N-acetyltransferase [Pontibacter sp.]
MEATYTFSFLKAPDMPQVRHTFLEAFADYVVPIQLTEEQFNTKVKREAIEPTFCVAAYAGSEMAGFILTGLGEYKGKPTAYNAGTGVLPVHRKHQLTRKLYSHLLPKLRESGIEQCVLEVIQENEAALHSYKAVGFTVARTLDCYKVRREELLAAGTLPEEITIDQAAKPNWGMYQHLWDVEPAWQNTAAAITRSPDEKIVLEARDKDQELTGYVAFFPKTGAIAQLAVEPRSRGKGIGKALLREVARHSAAANLMLINVDAEAVQFRDFLQRRYFSRFLGQYEMLLPLE